MGGSVASVAAVFLPLSFASVNVYVGSCLVGESWPAAGSILASIGSTSLKKLICLNDFDFLTIVSGDCL